MIGIRPRRKLRVLPRRRDPSCAQHELDRRLGLLLNPVMPAPYLRRRILEAVKRVR
jgi:hypothetical protein